MKDRLLRVINVTKNFGGIRALNNVSFDIKRGEVVGIIGPNGSGKTTLVNVISGYYKLDSGKIIFEKRDVTKLPVYKRVRLGIQRTFQGIRVFPYFPVYLNVYVSSESVLGPKLATMETSFVLASLGLLHKSAELPDRLTAYELKRLEIARALSTRPKIVFLDEPFAGLSPDEIEKLVNIIRYYNNSFGISFIIIEHKIGYLLKVVNRVIVLSNGMKIYDGDPREVLNNKEVVKAYIGEVGAER